MIAILGDSYAKVQADANTYDLLIKVALLLEYNKFLVNNRHKTDLKYI